MDDITLDKSRLNLFLIEGSDDKFAFDCFKDASKENGGFVVSWQTPEMLKERYGITIEQSSIYPANEIPKSNAINYLSLDDLAHAALEYIGCKCRVSLEAKMPFMLDGIEKLMLKYEPKSLCLFLHERIQNAKKADSPIMILINKNLNLKLPQEYVDEIEAYTDRYAVKHNAIKKLER